MNVPSDLLYTESHEWIRIEGDTATVGITDHAQHELSDVVFVQLPKVGAAVAAKAAVAVVESVKAASDIYTPMSGEITEINSALEADPALVNQDAFGKGWMFKLKLSAPDESSSLKKPEDYSALIGA